MISSFVKKAPTDKVILVGTRLLSRRPRPHRRSAPPCPGWRNAAQWAHDYLLSSGYSEADFTATVDIISRESGWNVAATNPSSRPRTVCRRRLPGSKMVSAGADWVLTTRPSLSGSGATAHSATAPSRAPTPTGSPTTATEF